MFYSVDPRSLATRIKHLVLGFRGLGLRGLGL